jgi:undecaprenyl-diphosphatase
MPSRTLAGAGLSLALFAVLAILTATGRLATVDAAASGVVYSWEAPALTAAMLVITNAGAWFVYLPITVVLLAIPRLRSKVGLPVAATMTAVATLNWVLKPLFAIPRPEAHRLTSATGFSFPSGHAMSAAAFAGVVALLFVRYSRRRHAQDPHGRVAEAIVSVLAALFALAVGFSRVYLGVHNPSDVIAGFAMGFLLSLLTLGVMDLIEQRIQA